jgi:ATP-dependent RNA helicase RhlE
MASFDTLNLVAPLMRTLESQGFETATPIQEQSIPILLDGKDLVGVAQTGSGKTAAFVLPMLQKLHLENKRPEPGMPRAVILAPTRELAKQIGDVVRTFSRELRLSHTIIFGGNPFQPQTKALKRGIDILIATPGRLLDHMRRRNVYFDMTTTFVLDEADRMLDMGFIEDVQTVADALPEVHQTVFFSATMGNNVRGLANKLLNDPVRVEVAQESTVAETIDHKVMYVIRKNKLPLVVELLNREEVKRVLIFTRTRRDADELSDDLDAQGFHAEAIHGDKKQRVRERTLQAFRNGRFDILVATDVAARGIDVPDITHVINYDIPIEADNYVHRIGRTGRAGNKGTAISLCEGSNIRLLKAVERIIRMPIEVDKEHSFHVDLTYRGDNGGGRNRNGGGRGFGGGGRDRGRSSDYSRGRDRAREGGNRDGGRPSFNKANGYNKDGGPRKEFGDRPDRGPRKEFSDRPRRDFNDRPERNDRNDRGPRKEYGDRPERAPRKEFSDRPRRDFNDRPERNDRPKRSGERVQYGERNHRHDGSDRSNRTEAPRRDFSERKPYGDRKFNDRPERNERNDRSERNDRQERGNSFGKRSHNDNDRGRSGGNRDDYQSKSRYKGNDRNDRGGRNDRYNRDDRPQNNDRNAQNDRGGHYERGEFKPAFDKSVDRSNPFDKMHRDGRPGRKGKANTKFAGKPKQGGRTPTGGDQPLTRYKSKTRNTLRSNKRAAG